MKSNPAKSSLFRSIVILFISALSFLSLTVNAQATSPLGISGEYNAFILQNFVATGSDIHGKLAAGGGVELTSYGFASAIDTPAGEYTLIAGDDVFFDNGQIYTGSVIAAGSVSGISQTVISGMENGSSVVGDSAIPIDFAYEFNQLNNLSSHLAQLASTGVVNYQWGGAYLTGDCVSPVQIFQLDGEQIYQSHTFAVDCVPNGATLIFNLSGSQVGMQNFSLNHLASNAQNILYNFYEAQQVSFASIAVEGSVLAPNAHIDSSWGHVNGTVIAKSWSGPMELHHVPFTGAIEGAVNSPPEFTSSPVLAVQEGELYQYQVEVSDSNGDPLSVTIAEGPEGMILDSQNLLSWQTDFSASGEYAVSLSLHDGTEQIFQNFTIVVGNVNRPPVIESVTDYSVNVGEQLLVQVTASDPDGDTLNYALTLAPAGMNIDSTGGAVTWISGAEQAGTHSVTVTVTDSFDSNAAQSFDVMVIQPNRAPVITSAPVTSVNENASYAYDVQAADPDGDSLTFGLSAAPQGMTIDAATGELRWLPTASSLGEHEVAFIVSDGHGLSVNQTFTLQVLNVNDAPIAADISVTTAEDAPVPVTLQANDVDGDTLSFTIISSPVHGQLTGTGNSLTYTPEPDFSGDDSFTYLASDGVLDSNIATVNVSVSAVNDAPSVTSSPITSGAENTPYQYQLNAVDRENQPLTYSLQSAPDGMNVDGTGLVTWLPGFDSAGEHSIQIVVGDPDDGTANHNYVLIIEDVNRPPTIADILDVNIVEGDSVTVPLSASDGDGDGDALSFSIAGLPAFATIANEEIVIAPDDNSAGTYGPITVSVSDGTDNSETSFSIIVLENNKAPVITSTPVDYVVQEDTWTYTLEASDPDGDELTYQMLTRPAGADFDSQSGVASWSTVGAETGIYNFEFSVEDSAGNSVRQEIALEILPKERIVTHEGTEFWIPVSINAITVSSEGTFDINLVSNGRNTEATLEIPALGVVENLLLIADQIATYSIDLSEFAQTNGFALNELIEDHAIHITADSPVSAYMINQKEATTDGYLGLPVASLGKEYIAATYIMLGRRGIAITVDGGQLGPIITIVATEDNTEVVVDPIMDIFPGGQQQIEAGTPITLNMNRGDIYNLETKGSFKADLTGSFIRADKPIGVLGQMECVYIPVDQSACDHIVEQLPSIESLATEYYAVPFWGRTDDGRFWYQEYGDTFRVVAPYENTEIYIDDVLRARLDQGEYYEFFGSKPLHVTSSRPVLMTQYSNGNQFDDGYRELESDFTDPFMVVVPPAAQFLKRYTINTPARDLAYNFVNLLVPTTALSTLTVDGQYVDETLFNEIPNSEFSYSQFSISPGSLHLQAEEPFGIYVYGYDYFESYGYLGGMALSRAEPVTSLVLRGETTQTLDNQWCAEATLIDAYERPVQGVRVKFQTSGATNQEAYQFSDAHGVARYCYRANKAGVDTVIASLNGFIESVEVAWTSGTQNLAPVIISLPDLNAVNDTEYNYQVVAEDPEGDELSYTLLQGPTGMAIDSSGYLIWPEVNISLANYDREKVVVGVSDTNGNEVTQSFELNKYVPFNTPPEFEETTISTTGIVGVPYVYNADQVQLRLDYPKYQVRADDVDEDAIFVDILDGPEEAYIQRIVTYKSSDGRGNDPRSCEGCIHYLRWIPQQAGEYPFELGLRDARGGTAESKHFTVNVAPNLPPSIVDFSPPSVASAGYEYSYVLNVENDLPPYQQDNLDNLRVFFEQAPLYMRSELVSAHQTQRLRIYWRPGLSDIGLHTIRLRVDDQVSSSATVEFTIEVVVDNQPPVITGDAMPDGEATIPYQYSIVASDPEGGALSYSLALAPDGMTVDEVTGVINWVPAADYNNEQEWIRYVVTDEAGLSREVFSTIRVVAFRNRAPEFLPTYRPKFAKVGMEFVHQMQAVDREGDNPVTYGLNSSASGPTIDSQNGTITWTPTTEGSFWLSAKATDSLGNYASSNNEAWYVEVVPAAEPFDGEIRLSPAGVLEPGESVTVGVVTQNEATSPQVTLTVDGQPVDVNPLLQAQITPTRVGRIPVTAVISDGNETITRTATIIVRDPDDTTPPVVEFNTPANNAEITAPTDIIGTVQDEGLASVLLAYKPANEPITDIVDLNDFTVLYEGSDEFDNQTIARLDTTMLPNGIYHLFLQATDANNNTTARIISVNVTGDLKVGNFSFTVEDLNIPVGSFPVTVSRTYDSRRRAENLDFGYGWSVDYQNIRLQENVEPTRGWYQDRSNTQVYQGTTGLFTARGVCAYPLFEKRVTVTLPNGDTESFNAAIKPTSDSPASLTDPDCYLTADRHYDLYFRPVDGTRSTLETSDGQSLYLADSDNGDLTYIDDPTPVNIRQYTLTTRNGYIYRLNQDFGLEQVEDPNGNTLTYNEDSIVHSSGKTVWLNRDAQGRIHEVVDPAGNSLTYTYNTAGDLTTVTDREDLQTTYTYNNSHGLLDITDPLGRKLVKNIYDDHGRLIAQEDSDGNRTDFNHDIEGRQSIITDRRGNVTIFYYDDRGNVTTQVDALGHTTQFTYDENDNQLSKTDALGHTSSATYNDKDDQLTQTDELGHTVAYEYNERGQETLITDAKGNAYTNTYSAAGGLLSIEDPQGNSASNLLNGPGLVTQTTDLLGNITSYTYDAELRKQTETDAEGHTTTFTYDDNNNVLTETRTRTRADGSSISEITTYEYDASDRLTATIDPLGNRTETEYDAAGQEVAHIDALGRRTEMDYNAYGRLTETRYPDGTVESNTYDSEGNLLSETDRNGNLTQYEYDAVNRQTAVIHPDNSRAETEYDALGRVTADIDPNGNRTEYAYDAAGQRTISRDANGNEHHFEYDANGNLSAEVDALNRRTEYSYNILNQRIQTTYANGSSTSEELDALGRRTSQTDQANITTHFTYDGLGRLTGVTDAQGNLTQYTYDEAGNKTSQTDAEGRTTTRTYDALGRVLTRTLPLGQVESFTYDAVGNMTSHTDFNGDTTTYAYDLNNRVSLITYADGATDSFTYDNNGNRTEAVQTDPLGNISITTYTYDSRNRQLSETQANGATLSYAYDAVGNRTSVTTIKPDGSSQTTTYAYDSLNRLQSVTDTSGITSYGYDAVGNRSSVSYPNGTSEVYTYDNLNRLTRKETYNAAGTLAQSYDYTLHPTGRRTSIDELSSRTTTYSYDDLYRLTAETITDTINGNYSASYQYDKVGNRTYETVDGVQTQYTYDDNDRLLQTGGTVYTYDNNGNTLTETLDGQTKSYTYNAKNELINVTNADLSYSDYRYNTDGIRISKDENGTQTEYLVDSNRDYAQVLEEIQNDTTVVTYFYGDDLISQQREGNTFFYHYDGLGSTRALSDAAGSLTDTWDYEAFGEVLNRTGDTENRYLFAGEQFDQSLNQYYLRARYYNQTIGRFTQQDTWMGRNHDPVTLHKYLYADADAANNTDPTGHFSLGSLGAASNIQSTLTTIAIRGTSLLRAYDTIQAVSGFFDFAGAVRQVMGQSTSISKTVLDGSGIPSINLQDAIESATYNFPKAIGTGIGDWARGYSTTQRKGGKLKAFLIYMPITAPGGVAASIPTPAKIRFGNKKVPIKLVFGSNNKNASGQLFGIGMDMGKNRQLVRMDYHQFNPGHGGAAGVKSNEISVIRDGNFHYHVNKWK